MGCVITSMCVDEDTLDPMSDQPVIKVGEGAKQQGAKELKLNYKLDTHTKVLGVGAFGKVFATHNLFDPEMKVAIKVMDKDEIDDHIENVMDEIRLLNTLDHPNIIKYYETYNDMKYIYLVMELAEGQPLFDKITSQSTNKFTEKQAASYMK